jgi:hypothetical protein
MTRVRYPECGRCGTRLARDNTSGRCAACQAAERDRVARPPVVPAEFWDNDALRRALDSRHMGRVIRAYRFHPYHGRHPLPQDVVAGWVGVTQGQLSRIEHGPAILHLDRLTHWAQVLAIPAEYLWFKLPDPGRTVGVEGCPATKDGDVRRRVLLELAGLGIGGTSVGLEALRHNLIEATREHDSASLAEWEAVAWDYAHTFSTVPPADLLDDLGTDLAIAQAQYSRLTDQPPQRALLRVIALLEAFVAQTLGNLGNAGAARRWWRTARSTADRSRDPEARTWIRGREIIHGLHERWPLPTVLGLADEAVGLKAPPCMGTGSVLAGRAQVLAAMGRSAEARSAMDDVYRVVDRLPARVTNDADSMYGWPEYRLRHTESVVYTHVGDLPRATTAQDRALALYPDHMFRARAQVRLHQAVGMVKNGDFQTGAAHACQILAELPDGQRTEMVLQVARSVAQAIPQTERRRPEATALRELLHSAGTRPELPAGPR